MISPRRRKRDSFLPWVRLGVDAAALYGALYLVFWLRFQSGWFHSRLAPNDYGVYYKAFHLIVLAVIFFFRSYGLYRPANFLTSAAETWRVAKAVVAGTLVLMGVTFFARGFSFSRTFLTMAAPVLVGAVALTRFVLGILVMWADALRGGFRNILILGSDDNSRKLVRFYKKHPRFSTRVVGFLDDRLAVGSDVEGVPVIGRIDELAQHIQRDQQVHEAVLAQSGVSSERVLRIIYECEKEMVVFRWIADIFGILASRMGVSYLGGVSILSFTDSPLGDWENRLLKRAMDLALSATALVMLSPVFLWIAVWIRRDSKGPVFYRQERIGEDGRRFWLIKFRTMHADAEVRTGPVWAVENDPRRTRIGAFLRRNNLDELPQLWNVFIGDMSLVGPRPERPVFVSQFKENIPRYMARHSIRSGITGWAQVNGLRGNTSIGERTKFDLYYIENWSLVFDLRILLMTLFARRNAY